jgi:hypothetical protein
LKKFAFTTLRNLLAIHAFISLAAGVVLIALPAYIPKSVGISLPPGAYLLSYFLGAAEIALAFLSYYSRNVTDVKSLRLICLTLIVFHATTAAVEVYAFTQGITAKIWINIAVRLAVVFLFWFYGLRRRNAITR